MSKVDAGRGMQMQAQGGRNTGMRRRPGAQESSGEKQDKPGKHQGMGDKMMQQRAEEAAKKVIKDRTAVPVAEVPRMPGETKEQMLPRKALGKQIIKDTLQNQDLEERVKLVLDQGGPGGGLNVQA